MSEPLGEFLHALDPEKPFNFVGRPAPPPSINVQIFQGPVHADSPFVALFKSALQQLRVSIDAGRGFDPTKGEPTEQPQLNAIAQLTTLTCALAFSEAQALLALVTVGYSAPARIHLRSLGELARRARAFLRDPALALQVYQSYVPSQHKIVKGLLDGTDAVLLRFDELAPRVAAKTDRNLTATILRADASATEITVQESDFWSKWSHGEITALGEIARRADQRPEIPLEVFVPDDGQGENWLWRGTLFTWHLLAALIAIGVEAEAEYQDLFKRVYALGVGRGWVTPEE